MMMRGPFRRALVLAFACMVMRLGFLPMVSAAEPIPHAQDRPPGEPLSPAEAIRKMTVPDGFRVEVVASEPDLVNPVAMAFDERGRIWVTESLEYPRKPAGPGRDRVRVLEDTDGDGKADKFTTFAEGFNIPSGIAVGHGGVWVANSPDVLFLRDTDGDGKADTREVVVSGFGRDDTHELPNSLTWGPDGWLYGWNGVFNQSDIKYRGKEYKFTCAIFRIHPRTRDFEVFCEGTSNPWGITWDAEGSAFASACVIDHLWHLVETGYYHRQGGPYPPFTWKIESIVGHKHLKAAYCGIHYFDSPAYPPQYRNRLYMGNIHGNSINVDTLTRNGATYKGDPAPDFLNAHDAWFMPVAQKTGPDGSLYVLDWYDRYHCYQDANRDPAGIDRLKGRLYRVRYKDTPRRWGFDLARESDAGLVKLLGSENIYDRDMAQRLLAERRSPESRRLVETALLAESNPRAQRMHALWALLGSGPPGDGLLEALLAHDDPGFRAWGVRAAGEKRQVPEVVRKQVVALARDPSPDVRLQVAIAARKLEGVEPMPLLMDVLSRSGDDPLIPRIVWRNLYPLLGSEGKTFARRISGDDLKIDAGLVEILPRAIEYYLNSGQPDPKAVAAIFRRLLEFNNAAAARHAIDALSTRFRERPINDPRSLEMRDELRDAVAKAIRSNPTGELAPDLTIFQAYWRGPRALGDVKALLLSPKTVEELRLKAFDAYAQVADSPALSVEVVKTILNDPALAGSVEFRGRLLGALGAVDVASVAAVVLEAYPRMEPELRPRAIELLTQRTPWGLALLKAIGEGKVSRDALNVNQVRKMLAGKDQALVAQVIARWGSVREGRNPQREEVVGRMRTFLRTHPGDPSAGQKVFQRVCAQCHKMYGEGQEVGPEITLNGRGSYEQLLSNVFDPSLVIGAAYQATIVATTDGRVLTGLLVEDGPQRLVLKSQGGKLETIARGDVEERKLSPLSLMPEDLEKQLTPVELADLFAFLTLDRPPGDPKAKPIPGTP